MISNGKKTPFQARTIDKASYEVEVEPLVDPLHLGVDVPIIRAIGDAILAANHEGRGVIVTIQPRPAE